MPDYAQPQAIPDDNLRNQLEDLNDVINRLEEIERSIFEIMHVSAPTTAQDGSKSPPATPLESLRRLTNRVRTIAGSLEAHRDLL